MALSVPTTTLLNISSKISLLPRFSRCLPPPLPLPLPLPFNSRSHLTQTAIFAAASASGTSYDVHQQSPLEDTLKIRFSNWGDFASRVSGEWDGYSAEFTYEGIPIELPEAVVPQAFREWEVQVFDWQTQCPTLAETENPNLTYKLIKLLPTVGCEADAATRFTVEERFVGGVDNGVLAFAYDRGGSYVAVWDLKDKSGSRLLELEHCFVDPRDQESRIRLVQVVQVDGTRMELKKIKIFSENWYGPFRNGEQLGGCAIRESGFASSGALDVSEVLGSWQGTTRTANFDPSQADFVCELDDERPTKISRDQERLVTLPKRTWCSLKETEEYETRGEVGWLLDHGRAMTSTCVFSKDGTLKKIMIGHESATWGG